MSRSAASGRSIFRSEKTVYSIRYLIDCDGVVSRQGYYEFDVDVSFYEIFDEVITDLLRPDNLASAATSSESRKGPRSVSLFYRQYESYSTRERLLSECGQ